jgi:osmotically-inducible protein OsmY
MVSRRDLVRALARVDGDIQTQVAGALAELARLVTAIQVEVAEGVVTLTGQVPVRARRLVESLAADVPGVRAVHLRPAPSGVG